MLHTTSVLSIVPSFCLLNRNFPPNNPSALSIFNYRLGLSYLTYITDCRNAAVSWHRATHTGSKQSYVNCVKILYCIHTATIISLNNALTLTSVINIVLN